MRLFGILLVVLCLVAGGAYVYFGAQDWKGRQTIAAAGFRHLLLVRGLPLDGPEEFAADDETPFEVRTAGGQTNRTVSKALLTKYFQDNTAVPAKAAPQGGEVPDPMAEVRKALSGTEPVLTQAAELRRVRRLLKAEFDGAANPLQKAAFLSYRLLNQAETLEDRTRYQQLASQAIDEEKVGDKGERTTVTRVKGDEEFARDLDELALRLDLRFYRVAPKLYEGAAAAEGLAPAAKWAELPARVEKAEADLAAARAELAQLKAEADRAGVPPDPAKAAKLRRDIEQAEAEVRLKPQATTDEGERRDRLAHLLVHLDLDAAWQKRAAVIVGLRRYAPAIAAQAVRFAQMRQEIDRPIYADQAAFQRHHDALQAEAAQLIARRDSTRAARENLQRELDTANDAVGKREEQLKALTAQLQRLRDEVDRLLVEQSGIEKELFELQREVGLTLEEVYRLEEELAKLERRRYGLSPVAPR